MGNIFSISRIIRRQQEPVRDWLHIFKHVVKSGNWVYYCSDSRREDSMKTLLSTIAVIVFIFFTMACSAITQNTTVEQIIIDIWEGRYGR